MALRARGLPLARVAHYLSLEGHSVTASTLSYWRSGRSVPRLGTADSLLAALERVLQTPADDLRAPLRSEKPMQRSQRPLKVEALLNLVECRTVDSELEVRTHHVILAGDTVQTWDPQLTLWSGVDHLSLPPEPGDALMPLHLAGVSPSGTESAVGAAEKSSAGRQDSAAQQALPELQGWTALGGPLGFERPLHAGDAHACHTYHRLRVGAATAVEVAAPPKLGLLMIDISVPQERPLQVVQYRRVPGETAPRVIETRLVTHGHYQAGFRDPVPGRCGVYWAGQEPE